jgi:hypothetical protein
MRYLQRHHLYLDLKQRHLINATHTLAHPYAPSLFHGAGRQRAACGCGMHCPACEPAAATGCLVLRVLPGGQVVEGMFAAAPVVGGCEGALCRPNSTLGVSFAVAPHGCVCAAVWVVPPFVRICCGPQSG